MSTDGDDQKSVALAKAVRRMREELPAQLEYIELQAQLTRARYLALLKQGFAHEDALRLCTQAFAI